MSHCFKQPDNTNNPDIIRHVMNLSHRRHSECNDTLGNFVMPSEDNQVRNKATNQGKTIHIQFYFSFSIIIKKLTKQHHSAAFPKNTAHKVACTTFRIFSSQNNNDFFHNKLFEGSRTLYIVCSARNK